VNLVRAICSNYTQCVIGPEAGALTPLVTESGISVIDTTMMPCQLQMGVFCRRRAADPDVPRQRAGGEELSGPGRPPAAVYDFTFASRY